jgi:hypothetical protein
MTEVEREKRGEKSAVIVERLVRVQLRAMGCERFELGVRRDAGEIVRAMQVRRRGGASPSRSPNQTRNYRQGRDFGRCLTISAILRYTASKSHSFRRRS